MGIPVPQNSTVPFAVAIMDGTTGALLGSPLSVHDSSPVAPIVVGANVFAINSNGTSAVNAGGGIYWGCNAIGVGALWTVAVYDINGTSTKQLSASLSVGALGALALAGPSGVPVKYTGNLTVVTAGTTAGALNVLWD